MLSAHNFASLIWEQAISFAKQVGLARFNAAKAGELVMQGIKYSSCTVSPLVF
jgi:hypothetical protein